MYIIVWINLLVKIVFSHETQQIHFGSFGLSTFFLPYNAIIENHLFANIHILFD